ncbi:hypothetical protein [Bacillus sp. NEAU-Y102]
MAGHVCDRMIEVNGSLPNYDKVSVEKDLELNIWEVTGQMGNERMEFPVDYCPFCGKELAKLEEE